MAKHHDHKLGLINLTALAVGSMLGSGIWSLPQNMSASAALGAIVIAWVVTGFGMWMLTRVFAELRSRRPTIDNGIFNYAKSGFGDYAGFNAGWGYWTAAWIGNLSYAVLLFSALGYFFPVFGQGNTLVSLIGQSLLVWFFQALVMRGVKEAAFVNLVTALCKIIPLGLFIVVVALAFKIHTFKLDIWGHALHMPLLDQVKSTMLVTAWVFLGIEGAMVQSSRARRAKDVVYATYFAFVFTLILYVAVTVLSYGVASQSELAHAHNPSTAFVLGQVIGIYGEYIINIGLVVSLLGAWLGWTILSVQMPFDMAKEGDFPSVFAQQNANESPVVSIWATSCLMQVFLVVTYFSKGTYLGLIELAASCMLIPYLFSAMFGVKIIWQDRQGQNIKFAWPIFCAISACVYAFWMIYAAGLQLVFKSALFYALGTLVYVAARHEKGEKAFHGVEWIACVLLLVLGCWGGWSLL
ncbi:Putative arginine/ornithine antiporter [BD1-7 clade bacterium]|nr:Putative arginine/ornithine antiporter [BD1-7 clade bacterium]